MLTRLIPLLLSCGLFGCAPSLSQQEVAREFWTAIAADHYDKATAFTKDNDISPLRAVDALLIEKIDLKAHQETGGVCTIPTTITATERGEAKKFAFLTVVEKANGDWKVNASETGSSLQESLGKK